MTGVIKGELRKLRKRPATLAVFLLASYFAIFQYYFMNYFSYRLDKSGATIMQTPLHVQLEQMSPALMIENLLSSIIAYIILVAIVFGALVAGNEYSTGTLKTIATQRPSKLKIYFSQVIAVGIALVVIIAVMFLIVMSTSMIIAGTEGGSLTWPPILDLIRSMFDGWLILSVWSALGMTLATVFRSSAVAIAVGVASTEILEGTVISFLSREFQVIWNIQEWLPLSNTQTLAWSWGLPGVPDSAPVGLPVSGTQFQWMPFFYIAGFIVLGALVFTKRDIE